MKQITFNVAALCNVGGRRANQDNIYLSSMDALRQVEREDHLEHLGDGLPLPVEGTMLLVADGMGGMNAGEVASQIVVDTIGREMSALKDKPINNTDEACAIVTRAIADADAAIKQHAATHPEVAGTGSTVVLLWLLGDKAVVAWCGDSRCYRYNPRRGLEQLSHDHSYVQQLVDEGRLRPERAFGHDQSNIITRCLSDGKDVALPDVIVVDVYRDDLFLLCSDGLCGLLPDEETEQIVKEAGADVRKALQACWQRGRERGWSDNVSIIFASVKGVDAKAPRREAPPRPQRPSYSDDITVPPALEKEPQNRKWWQRWFNI